MGRGGPRVPGPGKSLGRPKGSGNLLTKEDKEILAKVANNIEELANNCSALLMESVMSSFLQGEEEDDSEMLGMIQYYLSVADNAVEKADEIAEESEHPRAIEVSSQSAERAMKMQEMAEKLKTMREDKRFDRQLKLLNIFAKFKTQQVDHTTGGEKFTTINMPIHNNWNGNKYDEEVIIDYDSLDEQQ